MPNVIRPTFGAKPERPGPDDYLPLEIIGEAAGYSVGLLRGAGETGQEIRVVIGLAAGMNLEPVAAYPVDDGAEEDAQACARAVLRALEIAGGGEGPKAG